MSFDSPPHGLSTPESAAQLTEPSRFRDGDRVKWTGPPRSNSDGKVESAAMNASSSLLFVIVCSWPPCAGKSFYNEVAVSMAGVREVLAGPVFTAPAPSKASPVPESDW
jgi:hypothetical protein